MKKDILKIAGVKSEKEFYKKFPTEEAFMKAHGKEFKKAKMGASMVKKQLTQLTDFSNPPEAQLGAYIGGETKNSPQNINFNNLYDQTDMSITGSTNAMRQKAAYDKAMLAAQNKKGSGGIGQMLGQLAPMIGEAAKAMAKKGSKIKKAQFGVNQFGSINLDEITQTIADNNIQPANVQSVASIGGQSNNPNLIGQSTGMLPAGSTQSAAPQKTSGKILSTVAKYAGPAGKIIEGFQKLKAEKEQRRAAQQMKGLSELSLEVANLKPDQTERKYLTPWDISVSGDQLGNAGGVGTNVLAQYGASLSNRVMGGVPGEIMNTYDPNTIYSDLGYEPLEDSEKVKAFNYGGSLRKAQWGEALGAFDQAGGGDFLLQAADSIGGDNAGGDIGGTIGGTVGSIFGPPGELIGKLAGEGIGRLLDTNPQRMKKAQDATKRNMNQIAFGQGVKGIQGQNSSYMENGGWVSHDWQPQLITKFGDYNMSDLLKPDPTMDTLRTGGNIRQNNMSELDSYAFGGDLKIEGRGDIEFMGYNPETAKSGANGYIGISRGPSHDNGGFNIDYGGNKVEIEGNETVLEKRDGGSVNGKNSLIIFGDMKYGKMGESIMQDVNSKMLKSLTKGKDIKDVKFKHLGNAVAKKTKQLNKAEDKYIDLINSSNSNSIFDTLAMNSAKAALDGIDQSYKILDDVQNKSVNLQTAYHDTAKEFNYEDTPKFLKDIEKGKLTMAKFGGKISTAQDGADLPKLSRDDYNYLKGLYDAAKIAKKGPAVLKFQKEYARLAPDYAKRIVSSSPLTAYGKSKGLSKDDPASNFDGIFGDRTVQMLADIKASRDLGIPPIKKDIPDLTIKSPAETIKTDDLYDRQKAFIDRVEAEASANNKIPKNNKWDQIMDIANEILPRFRPSDAEALNPNQLLGEMYAMSQNQLEPVQAQTYQPELGTPMDISYQDILDANQADYNATQRLTGYNPAALSILNAQKYAANQKVLGEQFRANQAEKQRVSEMNRALLNDAKLKNLGILDQQYTRQAQAKSNTKATMQAALNSISSKYAQNDLANKTLQTYENEYNYRYGPNMKAINMNPLAKFNIPTVAIYDTDGNITGYQQVGDSKTASKKASKSNMARNGSIVKALKNL